MLLKSLPLLGALIGFVYSGPAVRTASTPDLPVIFNSTDPGCICSPTLTRNVVTNAPLCPQQGEFEIVFVPCFFTEYVTQGHFENGECPEIVGCSIKACKFPDIQVMLNWQFEAMHVGEGCYDSVDCCDTGVGYAGSTLLEAPDDVLSGAGSYCYMPWRRNHQASCGTKTLADWSGLKCDGRDDNDPWDYYEELWYECKQCELAGN